MPPTSEQPEMMRVILAVPGTTIDDAALLAEQQISVMALAATVDDLLGHVDRARALPDQTPLIILLHHKFPGMRAPIIARFARDGIGTVLLVEQEERQDDDLLLRSWPYSDYVIEQMQRLRCASIASWPPRPGELAQCLADIVDVLHTGVTHDGDKLIRQGMGGTIAFSGGIGGSGKTQLACNLAALLAVVCERRVLLMDMDVVNASIHRHLALDIPPDRGLDMLYDAAAPLVRDAVHRAGGSRADGRDDPLVRSAADESLAAVDLAQYVVPYPPSAAYPGGVVVGRRLDVLPGVMGAEAAKRVSEDLDTIHALIRRAREHYDDIILDLGTVVAGSLHQQLAARADHVLVVTWPAPYAVEMVAERHRVIQKNTKLPAERAQLVINHVPSYSSAMLSPEEILRRIGSDTVAKCAGIVPHDGTLVGEAHLRDGSKPLIPVLRSEQSAKSSDFVRAIEQIVTHVRPGALPERADGLENVLERAVAQVRRRFLRQNDEGDTRPLWSISKTQ